VQTISIERAHEVLGLTVFAEPDQVKIAYRQRAFACHPDAGGSAESFKELQAATELLCDPRVRERWCQQTRHAAAKIMGPQATPPRVEYVRVSSTRAKPKRTPIRRYRGLLAAAIFGYLLAPHFREIGLTWDPVFFHEFCQVMQTLDWVFLFAWWFVKKPQQS